MVCDKINEYAAPVFELVKKVVGMRLTPNFNCSYIIEKENTSQNPEFKIDP